MRTLEERFWSKVAISGPDDCWEWRRSRKGDGYGQFKAKPHESPQRASRVAWTLAFGPIPDGLWVLHRCDNPPCCNPAHLFLGTAADNNADKIAKGRAPALLASDVDRLVQAVRRLSDDDIRLARSLHAQGHSCRSIARRLDVAHTTVSRLVNGTHWARYAA